MSDDSRPVDPLDAMEAEASDPVDVELVQALRASLDKHARERAEETTDDDGEPLPRLILEGPRPETGDPLLLVGYALLGHLQEGWEYATLHASAAADDLRMAATVKLAGEGPLTLRHLHYLPDVAAACAELRRSMYQDDGRGAWFNITIMLRQNGAINFIVLDEQPPFAYWGPGDAELLRRDQELYPRDPEHLPFWHPAR
ncbi:hypothetical protein [Jiangella mangrovi]|uniref:Uncharacterized protein n=1 Tax=Jiangella mangrovi TaxID=1524084 RepID=A0A7W9GXN7_9ACTN|nr:hypothetical protein [Jiangella mangrovi]MBB5791945.1 hypothetical protein [Jiangella mangrovi]